MVMNWPFLAPIYYRERMAWVIFKSQDTFA